MDLLSWLYAVKIRGAYSKYQDVYFCVIVLFQLIWWINSRSNTFRCISLTRAFWLLNTFYFNLSVLLTFDIGCCIRRFDISIWNLGIDYKTTIFYVLLSWILGLKPLNSSVLLFEHNAFYFYNANYARTKKLYLCISSSYTYVASLYGDIQKCQLYVMES